MGRIRCPIKIAALGYTFFLDTHGHTHIPYHIYSSLVGKVPTVDAKNTYVYLMIRYSIPIKQLVKSTIDCWL